MKKQLKNSFLAILAITTISLFNSCDDFEQFEPIGANSIEDATPPNADFTAIQGFGDSWNVYTFANASTSATNYSWDFGDGNMHIYTEADDNIDAENSYPGEGTYTVTLTASDALGVSDTYTIDIVIVEPQLPDVDIPVILEGGFDNGDSGDAPTNIDSRTPWKNSNLGGTIQITSSNGYYVGNYGGKLPDSADRIGYQEVSTFTPNTDYVLTFKYRMKNDVDAENGLLNVLMMIPTNDPTEVTANTIASVTYSEDVAGTSELLSGTLSFNSGANTSLAIYFYNELDEAYIDALYIDAE
ncbi:PKD domain-containing protein [Lacinutrix sp. WUR7]|uniref:PKD domain-containing protein n=1 Tax=Lacinutrix sp. WUR7 TaxID=2653681 RepID=UPI00193E8C92|nr:PKD domain-containing protein [Lacinutrix sp. WUR7]QRM88908.1 PKD domain-containing protein [Lacinutrix sp. WUR7]